MSVQPLTCQHIDFNCWLDNCPVRWVRAGEDTYMFFFDDLDDDDQLAPATAGDNE
jgi:hypothetical protein